MHQYAMTEEQVKHNNRKFSNNKKDAAFNLSNNLEITYD
jgi:hypothetical protein